MLLHDQLQREIIVKTPINTVISLVPSHTELLIDLGLKSVLKGRTKFCIHPQKHVKDLQIVGGTKTPNFNRINQIRPDLIICNKEENNKEDVYRLSERYPVWVSDIKTYQDSCEMIEEMAQIFNVQTTSTSIIDRSAEKLKTLSRDLPVSAAYLIWRKPYMTVGSDTYINDIMGRLGYKNVFSRLNRYPTISIEDLKSVSPDFLLLSSEPFPFNIKHIKEFENVMRNTEVRLVDGEVFSWYGSRIIYKDRI